jgi:hypothetical protein
MKFRPAMSAALAMTCAVPLALTTPQPGSVIATGCVEQGIDAVCLMLRDRKSKKLYELLFTGARARPGADIQISGTVHHGPTICQRGVPVDVSAWTSLRSRCDAEPAEGAR